MNQMAQLIIMLRAHLRGAIAYYAIDDHHQFDIAVGRAEAVADILEDWFDYRYENAYPEDLKALWDLAHNGC